MKAQDLKNSILQLAVEGKLVPQDPSDEPASELLARIRKERAELIEQKKIRRPKSGESVIYREGGSWYERRGKGEPACIDDEIPFDIPEGWEWARLGSFSELLRGSGIKRSEVASQGLPCVRYGELYTTYDEKIDAVASHTCEAIYQSAKHIEPGELLMTLTGENDIDIGRAVFNNASDSIAFGGDLIGIKKHHQYAPYLALAINSSAVGAQRTASATGNIIVHLSGSKVAGFLVPIPPLEEQRRIVEKINELMPLVEEYGRLEDARDKLDAELPNRLRKSVLQLAMQGKLVSQDPSDEPATKLLERIRGERTELVKQGKAKRPKGGESTIYRERGKWYERRGKSEPACIDDEIPFGIPESWEWVRMGSVLTFVNGRAYKKSELLESGKYPVLRVGNLFTNSTWYYSDLELPKEKYCHSGDLLYAWSASFGPTIWNGGTCIFHYHIWNVLHSKELYRRYLYWFLMNDVSRVKSATTGSTMIHVSMVHMIPRLIAIPPFAEQKRIVEKVDQIMKLIGA